MSAAETRELIQELRTALANTLTVVAREEPALPGRYELVKGAIQHAEDWLGDLTRLDVTQVPKRAQEDETDPDLVTVPDCWHVAEAVRRGDKILRDRREFAAQIILETWHLAHRLLRHAQDVKAGRRLLRDRDET